MSSFLCLVCHSTVNCDTNEEIREKYREVVGMNLCPNSHLCYICCHVLNKLWLFKSICLKRSLEYPVLFREKGTPNLQKNDLEIHILCPEDSCEYQTGNINLKSYHFTSGYSDYCHREYNSESQEYVELEDERNDFEDYFQPEKQTDCQNFNINVHTNIQLTHTSAKNSDISDDNNKETENEPLNNYSKDLETEKSIYSPEINSDPIENVISDDIEKDANETEVIKDLEQTEPSVVLLPEMAAKKKNKGKRLKKKKTDFESIFLSLEEQKAELEARRRDKKYIEAEFKCSNCALGFLFKDTYQTHMMRHEESNGEYRCSVCTLRFASTAVLRAHTATHRERYTCARCGERARNPRRHACGGDEPRASCHLCAAMFRDSTGLQQHLKRYHKERTNGKTYSCNVCGKTYNSQEAVRTHMIKHINRKFTCDQCPATFSSPYTLNAHKSKHKCVDSVQHYCETCGLGYSTRKSLLAHKRNALIHQQNIFECPICARICATARALSLHAAVHSGAQLWCATCGARCKTRAALLRHARVHSGRSRARPALCHLCGGTFKGNNKLNRHLREVCEKAKLEQQLASYYEQTDSIV